MAVLKHNYKGTDGANKCEGTMRDNGGITNFEALVKDLP